MSVSISQKPLRYSDFNIGNSLRTNKEALYERHDWIGTEKQVMTRLYLLCDTKEELASALSEYMDKIKVFDTDGNNMVLKGFSVKKALELE